ncbi:hypothetical protein FYJ24_09435 [Actinomycetaceae bacterium WB03_NA08]|uniref:Uncharacterized protein n=1 Tax=Scrofimicrobium canadense TaxID=2652290 RepID=A0A6N7W6H3_9ACTO|nr:DUF6308 family protein [Scrofimicrobium canadense]MSS84981.1 hypothetical protein [Scrofimicrobium canadense]
MTKEFIRNSCLRDTLNDSSLSVELLKGYYRPIKDGGHFEGGYFDTFPPGKANDPHRFTVEDLLACSLLSADIKANGIVEILIDNPDRYTNLLTEIDVSKRFINIPAKAWSSKKYPGRDLYLALASAFKSGGIKNLGETRATKLMARKRPELFPITDSVVRGMTVGPKKKYWTPFSEWLNTDNNYSKLESIRAEAGLEDRISVIRVFDVIAWLIGSKKYKRILS